MAKKLINFKKIKFEGSSPIRREEYYSVAGVKITVKKERKLDLSNFEVDVEKDWIEGSSYWCTCKDCSLRRIPNGEEPKCVFVKTLKAYLKLKKKQEMYK